MGSSFHPFGSETEYAEPAWYRGVPTPYYTQSHVEFRGRVRSFVDKHLLPFAAEWDEQPESMPVRELSRLMAREGLFGAEWAEGHDAFHQIIFSDEMARVGAGGVMTALTVGPGIGLGPVVAGGEPALAARVKREVLAAEKFICLAVTEAGAGSDVAAVQTTAVLEEGGEFFVVSGEKKFISGAGYADYFTTAVQTSSGLSVLLVERGPGVTVRRLKTQGWHSSYTGFVVFDNVRVPVSHLIGREGEGFKVLMANFNSERLGLAVQSLRYARVCLEESVMYARRREVFGSPLWSSQVVRAKVAEMARRIEAGWAWAEQMAFAKTRGTPSSSLAGQLALLKVHATQAFELAAREASQIFGGSSYLRSGPGATVERLYREVRVMAIGGGSEEIMDELATRRMRLAKL